MQSFFAAESYKISPVHKKLPLKDTVSLAVADDGKIYRIVGTDLVFDDGRPNVLLDGFTKKNTSMHCNERSIRIYNTDKKFTYNLDDGAIATDTNLASNPLSVSNDLLAEFFFENVIDDVELLSELKGTPSIKTMSGHYVAAFADADNIDQKQKLICSFDVTKKCRADLARVTHDPISVFNSPNGLFYAFLSYRVVVENDEKGGAKHNEYFINYYSISAIHRSTVKKSKKYVRMLQVLM